MASSCSGALPASQVRRAPSAKWIELRQPAVGGVHFLPVSLESFDGTLLCEQVTQR